MKGLVFLVFSQCVSVNSLDFKSFSRGYTEVIFNHQISESFTINENTKKWTFGNKSSTNDSSFGVYMSETDDGYLGIALVEFGVWTGQETGTSDTDILGSVVVDEESGDPTIQYQVFVPSSFAK